MAALANGQKILLGRVRLARGQAITNREPCRENLGRVETMKAILCAFGSLASVGLFLVPATARAVDPAPEQGVTVLARGPVHEAFAEPATFGPMVGMQAPKQPPEPIAEEPPDQRPEGSVWIPGYWAWDSDSSQFIWVSGVWRVPPPGRRWVPGYWAPVAANNWQWVSGFWADAQQAEIPYQPAPPPSLDNGPAAPAPDDNGTYVPGVWVYRSGNYVWQPGYWLAARSGWVWTPASYCWTPSGYVYVSGYWDYPLEDRGVLFAPVAIEQPVVGGVFMHRPRFIVDVRALLASLFVRRGWGYYFGDYYGPVYSNAGWLPWVRWGPRCYDPLFCYYRWRNGAAWCNGLEDLYVRRFNGESARPGRTFVEQNKTISNANVNNLKLVHSFNDFHDRPLTRLDRNQLLEQRDIARHLAQQRDDRRKTEAAHPLAARGAEHSHLTLSPAAHPIVKADLAGRTRETTARSVEHPVPARPSTPVRTESRVGKTAPRTEAPAIHRAPSPRPTATHSTTRAAPASRTSRAAPAAHTATRSAAASRPAAHTAPAHAAPAQTAHAAPAHTAHAAPAHAGHGGKR
jgi:WXXGXW repeat (2 copies)